jgi:hypothetical protein
MPMIHTALEPMGVEITDESIECAIVLMFHGKDKISPLMQDLFKRLLKFVLDDSETDLGFAYLNQILAFIQVFYQKDPVTFLNVQRGESESFISMTFKLCQ